MKFTLAREHYHHYERYGYVEFEDLVAEEAIGRIATLMAVERGDEPEELYLRGRDLWRRSGSLMKLLYHRKSASVIADLTRKKPLRVGFDQYIPKGFSFERKLSLREIGSIQGIVGGYLLSLEGGKGEDALHPDDEKVLRDEEGKFLPIAPFSPRRGNVVFVDPEAPLDLSLLSGDQLLVAFCGGTAIYCHNKEDLHTHKLKAMGYGFGDKIAEKDLPTLLREFSL